MGTSGCPDAVTGGMMLSRRECPDARAQPKTTFRLCGVLETTTAAKRQELPGQVPLGFQTCAIPKAKPTGAPRLLENTGQCAVGVEKWAAAWQAGLVVWLAF